MGDEGTIGMPYRIAFLSIGLVVLTPLSAQCEEFPKELERWYVTAPPEEGSDQWFVANADTGHEWVVIPGKGYPRVRTRAHRRESATPLPFEIKPGLSGEGLTGERTTAKVDDGWIVGFNEGEFGAALWWFSPNGERHYRISDDNVVSLVPTTSGLLAVEGLAHGGVSKGRILRLSRRENGRWLTEPLVDLGHAPQVVTKDDDGSIVVATTNRLLRFTPASNKTDVILGEAFWGGLYPNSMVITASGDIFVGMRHGIAKIEKQGKKYKLSWMVPSKKIADERFHEGFK